MYSGTSETKERIQFMRLRAGVSEEVELLYVTRRLQHPEEENFKIFQLSMQSTDVLVRTIDAIDSCLHLNEQLTLGLQEFIDEAGQYLNRDKYDPL
jgi:hypothetical protein